MRIEIKEDKVLDITHKRAVIDITEEIDRLVNNIDEDIYDIRNAIHRELENNIDKYICSCYNGVQVVVRRNGETYIYTILDKGEEIKLYDSIGSLRYSHLINLNIDEHCQFNHKMAFHYITDWILDFKTLEPIDWLYSDWNV